MAHKELRYEDDRLFVRDGGARGVAAAAEFEEHRATGTCPFCEILAGRKPDQPVLLSSGYWFAFKNHSPEPHTRLHITVAARIPDGHGAGEFTFDDLSIEAKSDFGLFIGRVAGFFGIFGDTEEYSVYMRVGRTGDGTSLTVFHPCWHLVVSDMQPITLEHISPTLRALSDANRGAIEAAFMAGDRALYKQAEAKGPEAVWDAALKFLWSNVGLLRSFLNHNAGEIRVKLSNKAH